MADNGKTAGASTTRAWIFLAVTVIITVWAGFIFRGMFEQEPIIAGPGVTDQKMLSDYVPAIAGTPSDTAVFVLEGEEPGGTFVLFGGTHPQEVSGVLAATLLIENALVEQGRVIVVPQANQSGFTYTEPLQAFPHTFEIATADGTRWFRNGMRLSNPIHQWPDPELYTHYPSGEPMVGAEVRNLNRNYPGRPDGRFTERTASALMQMLQDEGGDILLDLHEAYPEYPIINMLVVHQRAFEIGALTALNMQVRGAPMDVMPSPENLHGLSHREFGDYTDAYALLSETANPAMGRLRGRTDAALVTEGKDDNYVRAAELGLLFVPFDEDGWPLDTRVARQLLTIEEMLEIYNETNPDRPVVLSSFPVYEDVLAEGIGAFLLPADGM